MAYGFQTLMARKRQKGDDLFMLDPTVTVKDFGAEAAGWGYSPALRPILNRQFPANWMIKLPSGVLQEIDTGTKAL
jgi:hypothetical protein